MLLLDHVGADAHHQAGVDLDHVRSQQLQAFQRRGAAVDIVVGHGETEVAAGVDEAAQARRVAFTVAELQDHVLGAQAAGFYGFAHGHSRELAQAQAGGMQVDEEEEAFRFFGDLLEFGQGGALAKVVELVQQLGVFGPAEELLRSHQAVSAVLTARQRFNADDGTLFDADHGLEMRA